MSKQEFVNKLKYGDACCERGYKHKPCFCEDKQQLADGESLPMPYNYDKIDADAFFAAKTVKELDQSLKAAKLSWFTTISWLKHFWFWTKLLLIHNDNEIKLLVIDTQRIQVEVWEQ